jgi:N6-adenosine-specific RNA methylase IME4
VQLIQTICADPPWPFGDKLPGASRGAAKNYRVQTIDDICSFLNDPANGFERDPDTGKTLPIHDCLAPDCRLFLWRVASMQLEALAVMRAWGFTLKTEVVWAKLSRGSDATAWDAEEPDPDDKLHFGMGRTTRAAHETCLVGVRGKPERLAANIRDVFFAPYELHSRKPETFYMEIVEKISPGPYLELFARNRRAGWISLGDELASVKRTGMPVII